MKRFHSSVFPKFITDIQPLRFTIDTSITKTFKITRLNKGTAPQDIYIDWGDGNISTYDNLLSSGINNHLSHTYTTANNFTIRLMGSIKESEYAVTYENNHSLIKVDGSIFIYDNSENMVAQNNNQYFYNCINLENIDKNLFRLCKNIKLLSMCFANCGSLEFIPNNLFKYNPEITDFSGCFYTCRLLPQLPENLFKHNTKATNVSGCFSTCISLKNLPENLFKTNTNLTEAISCFNDCNALDSIPNNLFINNSKINSIQACFYNCSNITSSVPELWDTNKYPSIINFNQCFYNCTKALNYESIPTNWK